MYGINFYPYKSMGAVFLTSRVNPCPAELGFILFFENTLDSDELVSDKV